MASQLTKEEQAELKFHFQGFEPSSLASVIWDSINSVGIDDQSEKIGIYFEKADIDKEDHVIFWDEKGVTDLPRSVFLQIMKMVAEETVKIYEDHYDLERTPQLKAAVDRLKFALEKLQQHISLNKLKSLQVRRSLRSENEPNSEELVQSVRVHHASYNWSNEEQDMDAVAASMYNFNRRRSTKGIEGVVDRLPELRTRHQTSSQALVAKTKNKIRAFSIFQKKATIDEDKEYYVHEETRVKKSMDSLTRAMEDKSLDPHEICWESLPVISSTNLNKPYHKRSASLPAGEILTSSSLKTQELNQHSSHTITTKTRKNTPTLT